MTSGITFNFEDLKGSNIKKENYYNKRRKITGESTCVLLVCTQDPEVQVKQLINLPQVNVRKSTKWKTEPTN